MSNAKAQMSNQIQSSNLKSLLDFELGNSFDICLPALPTAGRGKQGF
jgi:hypothetical protein